MLPISLPEHVHERRGRARSNVGATRLAGTAAASHRADSDEGQSQQWPSHNRGSEPRTGGHPTKARRSEATSSAVSEPHVQTLTRRTHTCFDTRTGPMCHNALALTNRVARKPKCDGRRSVTSQSGRQGFVALPKPLFLAQRLSASHCVCRTLWSGITADPLARAKGSSTGWTHRQCSSMACFFVCVFWFVGWFVCLFVCLSVCSCVLVFFCFCFCFCYFNTHGVRAKYPPRQLAHKTNTETTLASTRPSTQNLLATLRQAAPDSPTRSRRARKTQRSVPPHAGPRCPRPALFVALIPRFCLDALSLHAPVQLSQQLHLHTLLINALLLLRHSQLLKVCQQIRLDSLVVLALPVLLRCQPHCLATLLPQAFSFELCGTVSGNIMGECAQRAPPQRTPPLPARDLWVGRLCAPTPWTTAEAMRHVELAHAVFAGVAPSPSCGGCDGHP